MNNIDNDKIFVAVDPKRGFKLSTPILSNDYSNQFKRLFPKRKSISLVDVFDTINRETDFIDAFEPFESSRKIKKPDPIYFYGNILKCCRRQGVEDIFRGYFALSNLGRANKRLRRFIDDMELVCHESNQFLLVTT